MTPAEPKYQIAPDIRPDDPHWEGLYKLWKSEAEPAMVMLGNVTYLVLQDAQTHERFFRPINTSGLYESRSW